MPSIMTVRFLGRQGPVTTSYGMPPSSSAFCTLQQGPNFQRFPQRWSFVPTLAARQAGSGVGVGKPEWSAVPVGGSLLPMSSRNGG